jgi:8-oxo-dGTP pyrophosphatase MutT (NUDIX family)
MMADVSPVEPKPAASVMLVRAAASARPEPIEVYMIRRQKGMRFLGGYYAFPGGRVDALDGTPEVLARCRGLAAAEAEGILSYADGGPSRPAPEESSPVPALAYWVTAARELLEESGVLLGCGADGHPIVAASPDVAEAIERVRKGLMAGGLSFAELLRREDWYCDLGPLRYLSHFITPRSSPIRFSARFFLCPVPRDQLPRLFTEETSEGFWIPPGEGYRRFLAGEMAMAEPAEYGLAYLAQFESLDDLWAAHVDRRHKFHGIIDRIHAFWASFDWKTNRFPG